jgi:hypothetical protein
LAFKKIVISTLVCRPLLNRGGCLVAQKLLAEIVSQIISNVIGVLMGASPILSRLASIEEMIHPLADPQVLSK